MATQQPTLSPYQQHQQPQQRLMGMSQPLPNGFAATNSYPAGSVPNQHFPSGRSQPNFLNSLPAPNSFSAGLIPNQPQYTQLGSSQEIPITIDEDQAPVAPESLPAPAPAPVAEELPPTPPYTLSSPSPSPRPPASSRSASSTCAPSHTSEATSRKSTAS